MRLVSYVSILLLLFTGVSCLDSDTTCTRSVSSSYLKYVDKTKLASDIEIIDTYLAGKGITPVIDPTGLRYVVKVEGTGKERPCIESNIAVTYSGKYLNGTEFDGSIEPVVFPLNALILAWKIALPKFTTGTSVTLYVPSGYGYGPYGGGSIPANSILIFDVDLLDVK